MKLVLYEIKKVLCKSTFIIVLALSLIINIFLCYYQENTLENEIYITNSGLYNSLVSKYSSMSFDEGEKAVNDESVAYQILNTMNFMATAESADELKMYEDELEEYKDSNPKVYAKAERLNQSDDDISIKSIFLCDIKGKIEYIKSYHDFIDNMYSRAEEQASFSIFSDKNSFSYKNLFKTADDYSHLKNIELKLSGSKAVTKNNTITDLLSISMVFLMCICLFSLEKDTGLYSIVRSTKYGRLRTIISKLTGLIFLSVAVTLLFALSDFLVKSYLYGLPDFSANIQSLELFRNCTVNISTGEFLLYSPLIKSFGITVIAVIFSLVFVLSKSPSVMYITSMGIVLTEFLLYMFIDSQSAVNYLKYINLFYALDGVEFLGEYLNLDLFSAPVNAQLITIVIMLFVFIASVIITSICFSIKSTYSKKNVFQNIIAKLKSKFMSNRGSTSLFLGELFKYLIQNKMVIFLLIIIAFGVFNSFGTVAYPFSNSTDYEYKVYMDILEGDVTKEKIDFINKEQSYFDTLNLRLTEIEGDSNLTENTKKIMSNSINNILETKGEAFSAVMEEYDRITAIEDKSITPRFIDENLYKSFTSNSIREWKDLAIYILFLVILLPVVFTIEYKRGMINLIRPTKNGKKNLVATKLFLSLFITVIAYVAVYLPYYIRFINTYGTNSLSTSLCCLYSESTPTISLLTETAFKQLSYLVMGIFATAMITCVAVKFRNNLLVMIISSIVLIVPLIVIYSANTLRFGYIITSDNLLTLIIILSATIILTAFLYLAAIKETLIN